MLRKTTSQFNHGFLLRLDSGDGEFGDSPYPQLTIAIKHTYIQMQLPRWMVKPFKEKVYPPAWSGNAGIGGRTWYWQHVERSYGFSVLDGHVSLYYGVQTGCSDTEKYRGFFIPWKQNTFVEHRVYDLRGANYIVSKAVNRLSGDKLKLNHPYDLINSLPRETFEFEDFDGENIRAECIIEEREWTKGSGWCSWMKYFSTSIVKRSLDIKFSAEVGHRKGSWKGGIIGHGIDMLPNETITDAFKRYCNNNNLKYIGPVYDNKKRT